MRILFFLVLFPFVLLGQNMPDDAKQLIANKQFVKAEKALQFFIDKNPDNLIGLELLGDAFGYQKKWDKAIFNYNKLVSLSPDIAKFHYKYGGALGMKALSVNKFQAVTIIGDCKAAFLKAAELDPNHIDARWALVELYMQLPGIIGGSKSKSLKYASELEALSKVNGYLAKGYIYEYDDAPQLAEKYYRLALENDGLYYNKLLNQYQQSKTRTIDDALETPKRNAMYYQIGKVCADYNVELDKGELCLKIYLKNYSTKDGVPKAWAYFRLAKIFKHKGERAEALKWIDKAIVSLPKIEVFKQEKKAINLL